MPPLEHAGWFLVNIAIPLLAPLALLPLVTLSTFFHGHGRRIVRRAVEHGQLLWAALPMSASACYMLIGALLQVVPGRPIALVFLGVHICMMALSATGIVLGAIESCVAPDSRSRTNNRFLRFSLALTAITAAFYYFAYLYVVNTIPT